MRPPHSNLWPGVPLSLASAVLFGESAPFVKVLLGTVDAQLLAGLMYLGAGLGLAVVHFGRVGVGLPAPEASLGKADYPWLAAVVLAGGVAGPLLLVLGLARTSASSGSLPLNLEGLATMAIAWLVFRKNVDRRLLLGALAILAHAVLVSWGGHGVSIDAAAGLIAAACLAWGIDNNLTRKLSSADPVVTAMLKDLVAGIVNAGLALSLGAILPPMPAIGAAALLGFLDVGVSLVLFVLALRHLGAARTGAYYSLAPFIGAMIAIPLLNEALTPQLVGAGVLMAFGIWMHLAERHDHEHAHDLLEHDHAHVHDKHHRHVHDGPVTEPHSHRHLHEPMRHRHAHYPDLHHRHDHV